MDGGGRYDTRALSYQGRIALAEHRLSNVAENRAATDALAPAGTQSPENSAISDPEPKLVRDLRGNSRAFLLYLWKRENVSINELKTVMHTERKRRQPNAAVPTDKAVKDAVAYLEQRLAELAFTKTIIEKNGGLYRLAHPQK